MKIAIPILAAVLSHVVCAGDLTWDTTAGDVPTVSYDSGTWNLTSTCCWNKGSGNVGWSNAPVKNAVIPGAASGAPTITIGADALKVGKITVGGAGSTTILAGSYQNLTAKEIAIQTSGLSEVSPGQTGLTLIRFCLRSEGESFSGFLNWREKTTAREA